MRKLMKGKLRGIAVACLLVASLAGALVAPAMAQDAASVSIDPADSGNVAAGDSFTVDVLVDAGGHDLIGVGVEVQYDAAAMATSVAQITGHDLLGGMIIGPTVTDGSVTYDLVNVTTPQAGVSGSVLTIEFTIDAGAVPDDYDITLATATLLEPGGAAGVDVGAEVTNGTVTVPGAAPPAGPSVSIDPADSGNVAAGNSFTVDVLVDSDGNDLMGIDVELQYDVDAMSTSEGQVTDNNLLGGLEIGPTVTDGKVRYTLVNLTPQAIASDLLMSIEFAVDEDAVLGPYDIEVTVADLLDEGGDKIADVATNDGTVTVIAAGPQEFDQTFGPTALPQGEGAPICTIPEGASALEITLTTAASPGPDMDLELYDGATLVIGEGGQFGAPGGNYEGDVFGYSGYDGGEEFITADGPLGQAYDLMVYAYEAGTYTVQVYYQIGAGVDVTPPEIDIEVTATTPTVGEPVTVTVTATDPSGVAVVMFDVLSAWPGEWAGAGSLAAPQVAYEDTIQFVMSYDDEMSVTFVPGWAGTYTVEAWAVDGLENMTPVGGPVTEDFEVAA